MKKVLLSLAALGVATVANAQLLNYGFEDDQTAVIDTANWSAFPGSMYDLKSTENPFSGTYSLNVSTEATANRWERVIAFKQLPVEPMKSYRVRMKVLSATSMDVAILQGDWNRDIALQTPAGEQVHNVTFGGSDYETYSHCFWSPSLETMQEKYATNHSDELLNQYFLRLSFSGVGSYLVDDIVVEESSVEGIEFNGSAIKVNFGYATNAAALAAEAGGTAVLDNSCAQVLVNGEPAEVEAVEIKKDGQFYIFLTEDYWLDGDSEVSVSFTNPGSLKYSTEVAPESFETPNALVYNFAGEAGVYNEELNATSIAWEEAELVASNPANDAFEIDENIAEFSFTFNKPVFTTDEENGAVTATLDGVDLVVVEAAEAANTIKFTRASTEALGKGSHTLTIDNVCNEKHVSISQPITVGFEVGQVQVAQTVYTDLFTTLLEGANAGQPTGWSIMVGGENWAGGEPKADNGSACRNLNVTSSDGQEYTAFYLCDRDGYTYMQYGDQEGYTLTMPAGDIEFSVIALSHDEAGHTVEFRLEDMEGNEVAKGSGACSVVANTQFSSIEASDYISVKFNNAAEKNMILKVRAPQGGYTAVRVLGFKARSYEMTEGDTSDSQIVFASNFTGANMPAEGTGWLCYDNNNQLTPGSGRNGTSGMLERNFHAKMQTAAFFRECGDNADAAHRIDYGYGNGVEDGLTLSAGSYEVVYYAGTWNDANGNANGTSKVFFQIIDAESGAVVLNSEHVNIANFENGGACNGQADKVVLSLKTSSTGTYKFKAWGTHNTVWGALSIEKEGSKAVKYHTMLNEALDLAKAELELSADEANDGTTKTALLAAVAKYGATPNGMHTPAEYTAAIAELNGLTDALKVRRETIVKYNAIKVSVAEYLEGGALAEKFMALDCVATLTEAWATYQNVAAQDLEDAELISANATLTKAFELTKHMVDEGVPTLTAQITALVNNICTYDAEMETNETIVAAGNAISDDQALADVLKLMYTKIIYQKIVAGNPFVEVDPDFEIEMPATIDATCFIQNPGIYCIAEKHDATNISNYPGWNCPESEAIHGLRPNYGWGGWTGTATHTINKNMFLGIGWEGNYGINVWNNVTNLPVGTFDLIIETMDRSGAGDWVDGANTWPNPERQLSYIYNTQNDVDTITKPFNCTNLGQYYSFTPDTIPALTLTGETVANTKIGAYIHAQESFAAIQKAQLVMTAKAEGFDYAAAIAKIDELIASDIQIVEREDAPVAVTYFNLNGQKSVATQGVNIKVERYADGYTVVKKVIIK